MARNMIRFLFRAIATFSLAVAVVLAVLDATRSIAADTWVITSLTQSWRAVSPATLDAAEKLARDAPVPGLWDPVAVTVLGAPGFAVFAGLALVFYVIGHRRGRRKNRFATA